MKTKIHFSVKKVVFLFLLIFFFNNVQSQSGMPEARNTVYLSFGASPIGSIGFGLYYERMVSPNASIRMGINYSVLFHAIVPELPEHDTYISLPITINYLTSNNNKFEFGVGGGPYIKISELGSKFSVLPAGSMGYRYQLESKSMFFKVGAEFPAAPAINIGGFGYHF